MWDSISVWNAHLQMWKIQHTFPQNCNWTFVYTVPWCFSKWDILNLLLYLLMIKGMGAIVGEEATRLIFYLVEALCRKRIYVLLAPYEKVLLKLDVCCNSLTQRFTCFCTASDHLKYWVVGWSTSLDDPRKINCIPFETLKFWIHKTLKCHLSHVNCFRYFGIFKIFALCN